MTKNNTARLAGFVYMLVVFTGYFNLAYVPSQLIVFSDPSLTVSNITANESLFRWGIVAGVFCYIFYLTLAFLLFDLFKGINKRVAISMVVLAAASIPISIFNMVNKLDVLTLLSNASYLSTLDPDYVQAQVMLKLRSYNNGIGIAQVFWGLWLLPFGYLAFKSNHIPKILGLALMIGCFGWLAFFFGYVICPDTYIPSYVRKPAAFGEILTGLWLLVMGARESKQKNNADSGLT